MQHEKVKRAQAAAADAAATGGSDAENARAWVCKDIVVKVMAKHLHDYYKLKGRVVAVIDEYVAEVEMVDSGDVLRIDQAELETVRLHSACMACLQRAQPAQARASAPCACRSYRRWAAASRYCWASGRARWQK